MNQTSPAQDDTKPAPADAGKDCTVDPAPQPKAPPVPGTCKEPDKPKDPPDAPTPTVTCERPECCPKDPPGSKTCLEDLIAAQQEEVAKAESAKAFKTELEGLAQKSKAAKADYTAAKYALLLERWKNEDKDIVDLIAKLICTAPCWRTQVECFICPLLYEIKLDAEWLYGKAGPNCVVALYDKVYSGFDLQYWHQRNVMSRQETFDRIRAVLAAWEKPAATIEAVLNDNSKLLDAIRKGLGAPDAGKLIWDLFLRVIPMHLLIAPPSGVAKTGIDKKYVDLCKCDIGCTDDCCGPDTGVPSVLAQWLGPQPYLIDPDQYDALICCLVQTRYLPAKNALAAAQASKQSIDNRIASVKTGIADKKKALEANAKAKLGLPFDCCKKPEGGSDGGCPPAPAPAPTPAPPPSGDAPCPPAAA